MVSWANRRRDGASRKATSVRRARAFEKWIYDTGVSDHHAELARMKREQGQKKKARAQEDKRQMTQGGWRTKERSGG